MFYPLYDSTDQIIGTKIMTKKMSIEMLNWNNEEYQSRTNLCDSGYKFYVKNRFD